MSFSLWRNYHRVLSHPVTMSCHCCVFPGCSGPNGFMVVVHWWWCQETRGENWSCVSVLFPSYSRSIYTQSARNDFLSGSAPLSSQSGPLGDVIHSVSFPHWSTRYRSSLIAAGDGDRNPGWTYKRFPEGLTDEITLIRPFFVSSVTLKCLQTPLCESELKLLMVSLVALMEVM